MRVPTTLLLAAVAVPTAIVVTVFAMTTRSPIASAAPVADADLRSTVSVVGDGRLLVQPDVALASFGVEATGQTLSAAQAEASTRMQAVVDTLVGLGISRDDIRTNRLSASPVYDPKNTSVIQGYRAANSVQVKLRQLDQVGALVDAVTAAGANRVDGLSFAIDNLDEPKGQARGLAMQNARVKADQLASLAGMRIVGIKSIEEADPSATPVRAQPAAARSDAFAAAPPPPVEPGTQEVRTQVAVTYIVE
jgi:uncharacterized protein YggE